VSPPSRRWRRFCLRRSCQRRRFSARAERRSPPCWDGWASLCPPGGGPCCAGSCRSRRGSGSPKGSGAAEFSSGSRRLRVRSRGFPSREGVSPTFSSLRFRTRERGFGSASPSVPLLEDAPDPVAFVASPAFFLDAASAFSASGVSGSPAFAVPVRRAVTFFFFVVLDLFFFAARFGAWAASAPVEFGVSIAPAPKGALLVEERCEDLVAFLEAKRVVLSSRDKSRRKETGGAAARSPEASD